MQVQTEIDGFVSGLKAHYVRLLGGLKDQGIIPKQGASKLSLDPEQAFDESGWDMVEQAYLGAMTDMVRELRTKMGTDIDREGENDLLEILRLCMDELATLKDFMVRRYQEVLIETSGATFDHATDVTDGLGNEFHSRLITVVQTCLGWVMNQIEIMRAKNAGFDEYAMVGPKDPSTRPNCLHWVGTRFTEEEYMEHADDWGRSGDMPFAMLGGYNCRHSLVMVTDRNRKKYPKGPREVRVDQGKRRHK